jgi:hypothetical protein
MQGYEYYVIDGVAGGYVKAILSREILNLGFHVKRKKDVIPYRIPFRAYAKTFVNSGYAYHPDPKRTNLIIACFIHGVLALILSHTMISL